jgi:SAM-dependent methyltransferase
MSPLLTEDRPVPDALSGASSGGEYETFGNMEARNGLQARIEIPLLLHTLRPPLGGRVLEVGCGRGIALPVLAERLRPATLTGIDIDPSLVAIARERVQALHVNAAVLEGDLRELPFADGSFDLLVDFGTCYHVAGGREGARHALREVARVLRPGGMFIHETPIAQHLAHPVRSFGRSLPWDSASMLVTVRRALLWTMRRKAHRPPFASVRSVQSVTNC